MPDQLQQGDLVSIDGETHVVVSRTCDLVEGRHDGATAHVAQLTPVSDQIAGKGWNPRLVRIPAATGFLADMTTVRPVLLDGLRDDYLSSGCRTEEDRRSFRREAGRWLSLGSLPDDVHRSLRKVTEHIKNKVEDELLADLLHEVAHLRVRLKPLQGGGMELQVVFVTRADLATQLPAGSPADADMNAIRSAAKKLKEDGGTPRDRAALVVSYCDALAAKIKPTGVVKDSWHEVSSPHEMMVADYMKTEPLDLDLLSLDEAGQ